MSNLANSWTFYIFSSQTGKNTREQYEDRIHRIGQFDTIERFWAFYSHMKRPSSSENFDGYHLFRGNIRAVWENDDNKEGGKWIIHLQKSLASYYWEKLIIALIGEQFPVDVVGAVISPRSDEYIISLWNKTASDETVKIQICKIMCSVLSFPIGTKIEYKKHSETSKDYSYYQIGINGPTEIAPKKPLNIQLRKADGKH